MMEMMMKIGIIGAMFIAYVPVRAKVVEIEDKKKRKAISNMIGSLFAVTAFCIYVLSHSLFY